MEYVPNGKVDEAPDSRMLFGAMTRRVEAGSRQEKEGSSGKCLLAVTATL